MTLRLFLLILACILFFLSGVNVQAPRVNLIGLGLSLWVLSILISGPP
jgi:hypothetical protein